MFSLTFRLIIMASGSILARIIYTYFTIHFQGFTIGLSASNATNSSEEYFGFRVTCAGDTNDTSDTTEYEGSASASGYPCDIIGIHNKYRYIGGVHSILYYACG